MQNSIFASFYNELKLFAYDKWLLAMVTIIPLLLMLLLNGIFQNGVVRALPVAVVDMDNSSTSRAVIRAINASPTMSVRDDYLNVREAVHALRDTEVYAVVSIPPKFAEKVIKHQSPSIDAFYNTQFVLVGRTLASSLQQIIATLSVGAAVVRDMTNGNTPEIKALADSVPVQHQITPLYNMGSRYDQFLLTVIIPCAWQILIMATMVLSYSAQDRKCGVGTWVTQYGLGGFIAKLVIYQALFLGMGIGFLYYFNQHLQIPIRGSWSLLIFHQYLMIVASQAVASLFYFITLEPARALSISAAYVAPALAFVGITFPANSMGVFPQIWRSLLPITHYMRVQVTQVNYGLSEIGIASETRNLALFALLFLLVWIKVNTLESDSNSGAFDEPIEEEERL